MSARRSYFFLADGNEPSGPNHGQAQAMPSPSLAETVADWLRAIRRRTRGGGDRLAELC